MSLPRSVALLATTLVALLALAAPLRADEPALELSLLSYNTRGLPEIVARDGAAERHRRIGGLANAYDLVLLQEDFFHHEALLESAHHPLVVRGNGTESWNPLYAYLLCPWCGSGLTILAALDPERLLEVERRPFGVCAGWFSRRLDCWASKGFLRARLELAPGVEVDVYDLHLDAGTTPEDLAARHRQLEILREGVLHASADRALLVAGDFNVWSAIAEDGRRLEELVGALGLRRVAVPPITQGWPDVDRIYYRSGRGVRIEAIDASIESAFVDDEGRPLSDHAAIAARFRITPARSSGRRAGAAPSRDRRRRGTRPAGRRSRRRRRRASRDGSR